MLEQRVEQPTYCSWIETIRCGSCVYYRKKEILDVYVDDLFLATDQLTQMKNELLSLRNIKDMGKLKNI